MNFTLGWINQCIRKSSPTEMLSLNWSLAVKNQPSWRNVIKKIGLMVLHVLNAVGCPTWAVPSHRGRHVHHRQRPIKEGSLHSVLLRVTSPDFTLWPHITNLIVFTSALIARKYILTWLHVPVYIYFFLPLLFLTFNSTLSSELAASF